MAEIKPIKAWRYNAELQHEIENLTSPLFDVVSPKQREALYRNPYNSIHLSVPKGGEESADMIPPLQKFRSDTVKVGEVVETS